MKAWEKGDVAIEELQFPVASSQPHQALHLSVGLYYPSSGERLAIRNFTLGRAYNASLVDGDTALLVGPPRPVSQASHAPRNGGLKGSPRVKRSP